MHLFVQNQDHFKAKECNDVLWIILLILSLIAAIIALPLGIHACVWAFVVSKNIIAYIQLYLAMYIYT